VSHEEHLRGEAARFLLGDRRVDRGVLEIGADVRDGVARAGEALARRSSPRPIACSMKTRYRKPVSAQNRSSALLACSNVARFASWLAPTFSPRATQTDCGPRRRISRPFSMYG
jgi:hypothetical protein